MSHKRNFTYPQPTQEQLDQEPVYWKAFNEYWWAIVQQKIGKLLLPRHWNTFTAELEQHIYDLMSPDMPPIPFWVNAVNFVAQPGEWGEQGAGLGIYNAGIGWEAQPVGDAKVCYLKMVLPQPYTLRGMFAIYDMGDGTGIRQATLRCLNPGDNVFYNDVARPIAAFQHMHADTAIAGVTEVRAEIAVQTAPVGSGIRFRSMACWFEGENPF